ncbi:hypothetical protein HAX54_002590 [Datura stramonium]|uniref:Uncharacterized protein n=1 Tax=Datura stramonium TaxID=4076 RepID=A0ABS8T510_DATST|nr:hypothetical protein [Datura stramonium]
MCYRIPVRFEMSTGLGLLPRPRYGHPPSFNLVRVEIEGKIAGETTVKCAIFSPVSGGFQECGTDNLVLKENMVQDGNTDQIQRIIQCKLDENALNSSTGSESGQQQAIFSGSLQQIHPIRSGQRATASKCNSPSHEHQNNSTESQNPKFTPNNPNAPKEPKHDMLAVEQVGLTASPYKFKKVLLGTAHQSYPATLDESDDSRPSVCSL